MLIPLELEILAVALRRLQRGEAAFHGFALATELRRQSGAKRLTSHGTLYKALARLEEAGFLDSHWEDPAVALQAGRPRRRLYVLTAAGEAARAAAEPGGARGPVTGRRTRPAPGTST